LSSKELSFIEFRRQYLRRSASRGLSNEFVAALAEQSALFGNRLRLVQVRFQQDIELWRLCNKRLNTIP
jgi:hypothetical protein